MQRAWLATVQMENCQPREQAINMPPAMQLYQFHPDPASKQSTLPVGKQIILLYRQNRLHFVEYFNYLSFIKYRILLTTVFTILNTMYMYIEQ